MNKQEQIEKMVNAIPDHIVKGDFIRSSYITFSPHRRAIAEVLVDKGYINGADFVEWLKENCAVYVDNVK